MEEFYCEMAQKEHLEEVYQNYHHLLFAIAYRMLGSASDAEDVVQECYIRYTQASTGEISSLKSYLTTIVTRLCLDHLKSAHVQREQYRGNWLPEPILTPDTEETAWRTVEQHEDISIAFLLLLERLTPYERAVFLLREVFSYDYEEIAEIVGKSATYCRQIFHQAKGHIHSESARFSAPPKDVQQQLVEQFLAACQQGDMKALVDVLEADVTWWADGGGKVYAAPYPLHGRERVVKLLSGLLRQFPHVRWQTANVNGGASILVWDKETLLSVLTCEMTAERIVTLYEIINPDKLVYIQQQALQAGN
jgi:RNA polymerase sigma-70 factor (ECF subfamily)